MKNIVTTIRTCIYGIHWYNSLCDVCVYGPLNSHLSVRNGTANTYTYSNHWTQQNWSYAHVFQTYFAHSTANLRGRKQVQLFLPKERYSLTTELVNVYNHFPNELKRALDTKGRKSLELIWMFSLITSIKYLIKS